MKVWILLIAIASMHLTCDAKPTNDKLSPYVDLDLKGLLSKIPNDMDKAEILRYIYSIMGQVVSQIKKKITKI